MPAINHDEDLLSESFLSGDAKMGLLLRGPLRESGEEDEGQLPDASLIGDAERGLRPRRPFDSMCRGLRITLLSVLARLRRCVHRRPDGIPAGASIDGHLESLVTGVAGDASPQQKSSQLHSEADARQPVGAHLGTISVAVADGRHGDAFCSVIPHERQVMWVDETKDRPKEVTGLNAMIKRYSTTFLPPPSPPPPPPQELTELLLRHRADAQVELPRLEIDPMTPEFKSEARTVLERVRERDPPRESTSEPTFVAYQEVHYGGYHLHQISNVQQDELREVLVCDLAALWHVKPEDIVDCEGNPRSVTLRSGTVTAVAYLPRAYKIPQHSVVKQRLEATLSKKLEASEGARNLDEEIGVQSDKTKLTYIHATADDVKCYSVSGWQGVKRDLETTGPLWVGVHDGLNMCFVCENTACDVYVHAVQFGFPTAPFRVKDYLRQLCTQCSKELTMPMSEYLAFFNCMWKVVREHQKIAEVEWVDTGNHTYQVMHAPTESEASLFADPVVCVCRRPDPFADALVAAPAAAPTAVPAAATLTDRAPLRQQGEDVSLSQMSAWDTSSLSSSSSSFSSIVDPRHRWHSGWYRVTDTGGRPMYSQPDKGDVVNIALDFGDSFEVAKVREKGSRSWAKLAGNSSTCGSWVELEEGCVEYAPPTQWS